MVKLKADKERDEAKSTGDERIQMNSLKLQKMAELRKEEGKSFSDTVLVQMKKRQEEAKRKVELLSRSRVKEYEEEEEKANLGALNPLISELKREMKGQGIGGRSTVRTDHDRREESKGNARGRGREDEEDDEEDDDVSHRIIKKKSKPAFM